MFRRFVALLLLLASLGAVLAVGGCATGGTGSSSTGSSSYGRAKTVNVRGYTRKDGTYVRPHTRSAPRRR